MATKIGAVYDGLNVTDLAVGVSTTCTDFLYLTDEALSGRHDVTAIDTLVLAESAEHLYYYAEDYLTLSDRLIKGSVGLAEDWLNLHESATVSKWADAVDALLVTDLATGQEMLVAKDTLTLIEEAVPSLWKYQSVEDTLMFYEVADWLPPACEDLKVGNFVFLYNDGYTNQYVAAKPPDENETQTDTHFRTINASRGGDMVLTAPYGFRTIDFSYLFTCDEETKEALAFFIDLTTGQRIQWRDHHGKTYYGFIADPSAPFIEEEDGQWRVQLDFTVANDFLT